MYFNGKTVTKKLQGLWKINIRSYNLVCVSAFIFGSPNLEFIREFIIVLLICKNLQYFPLASFARSYRVTDEAFIAEPRYDPSSAFLMNIFFVLKGPQPFLFLFLLAGNQDYLKGSNEFEFRPDRTTDNGVSCP